MSNPEEDIKPEDQKALLESASENFVETMKSLEGSKDSGLDEALDDVERIRFAFESSARRALSDTSDDASLPGFPGFSIIEKIGQGGFGVVYRALDEKLDRTVALKVLSRRRTLASDSRVEARRQFLHEARALAKVEHENVLTIHAVLEEDEEAALVMEYIDGQTLEAILEKDGPLGEGEAVQVGIEAATALSAVHSRGMAHRDVKLANIMRRRGGRYVLTDFGLGIFLSQKRQGDSDSVPRDEGVIAGTPLFMSPEQVNAETVDARSDIYALGVVLYHLVTGESPYPSEGMRSLSDLFKCIRQGKTVPLRDRRPTTRREFIQVVEKAMALDPAERYSSAGELERALREVGADSTQKAPARETGLNRRTFLTSIAAVLAIIFLIFTTDFRYSSSPSLLSSAEFWAVGKDDRERELQDGESVEHGERFHVTFRSGQLAHVYVLSEDLNGQRHCLFPHPKSAYKNPLVPGTTHDLPGIPDLDLEFEPAGGKQSILLIASTSRLEKLEAMIQGNKLDFPEKEAEQLLTLRGFGLAESTRVKERVESGVPILEVLFDALVDSGQVEGWKIRLLND